MLEGVILDLDETEVQGTQSALGEVLETTFQAGQTARRKQEFVDLLKEVFVQQTRAILPVVLRFPQAVQRRWGQLCSAGWAGHTAEVHAVRDSFLESVEGKLRLIAKARRVAETFATLTGDLSSNNLTVMSPSLVLITTWGWLAGAAASCVNPVTGSARARQIIRVRSMSGPSTNLKFYGVWAPAGAPPA